MVTKHDYTWQVTSVNIFLLTIASLAIDGINRHYFILEVNVPLQIMAGIIVVNLLFSCVVTGILYLFSRNRDLFRTKRCLIITAWVSVFFQFYAVARADDSRDAFVQSFYQSCYQDQRANSGNTGVPEKNISDYCTCTGNNFYDSLTSSDFSRIEQLAPNRLPPPSDIQNKLNNAGRACMKSMISNMSPSELEQMDRLSAGQRR
jgi:hypothetical protein